MRVPIFTDLRFESSSVFLTKLKFLNHSDTALITRAGSWPALSASLSRRLIIRSAFPTFRLRTRSISVRTAS